MTSKQTLAARDSLSPFVRTGIIGYQYDFRTYLYAPAWGMTWMQQASSYLLCPYYFDLSLTEQCNSNIDRYPTDEQIDANFATICAFYDSPRAQEREMPNLWGVAVAFSHTVRWVDDQA